jgi:hypothetical protein
MGHGQEAGNPVERGTEVVMVTQFDGSGVEGHPHFKGDRCGPRLAIERDLDLLCGMKRFGRGVESDAESITHRFEHMATGLDHGLTD